MKLIAITLLLPLNLWANGITGCGEYTIKGVVRALPTGLTLVVNEKTMSEYKISMPVREQGQLGGYINKPVTVKALLDKTFDGTKGSTNKIISVDFRVPDPLMPADTGFKLESIVDCKKE